MVVKTETCSFSGFRIYPGHGIFFIRGDSKGFRFINRKSKSLFTQRLNPRKLAWTTMYRRIRKKGTLEESQKKKARKVNKSATKAVVGASLELIKAKRNQKPEVRAAQREAALREIKAKQAAKQAAKKEANKSKAAAAPKQSAPKQSKAMSKATNKSGAKGVRR
jgi:large subunit ribosomal protein L24e